MFPKPFFIWHQQKIMNDAYHVKIKSYSSFVQPSTTSDKPDNLQA